MDSIVLRVSELKKVAAFMAKDRMDYVQLMLLCGDAGEELPPCATFTGLRANQPFELVEYDELDGVPAAEANFDVLP